MRQSTNEFVDKMLSDEINESQNFSIADQLSKLEESIVNRINENTKNAIDLINNANDLPTEIESEFINMEESMEVVETEKNIENEEI